MIKTNNMIRLREIQQRVIIDKEIFFQCLEIVQVWDFYCVYESCDYDTV